MTRAQKTPHAAGIYHFGGFSLCRSINAASISGPASSGWETSQSRTQAASRKLHCSRLRCGGVSGRPGPRLEGRFWEAGSLAMIDANQRVGNPLGNRESFFPFVVQCVLNSLSKVSILIAEINECGGELCRGLQVCFVVGFGCAHASLLFAGPHRAVHVVNVKQQLAPVKRIVVKHKTVTSWGAA